VLPASSASRSPCSFDALRGDTVLIHSGDTDAVARRLLNQTPARDLEITSRGLEQAFLALTGGGAGPAGESQAAV
jgi:hypothetical protein